MISFLKNLQRIGIEIAVLITAFMGRLGDRKVLV